MLFFLLFLVPGILAKHFDVFIDMYNENRNDDVDPCDNFYRHACRIDLPDSQTIEGRTDKVIEKRSNAAMVEQYGHVLSLLDEIYEKADELLLELYNNVTISSDQLVEDYGKWCAGRDDSRYVDKMDQGLFWLTGYESTCEKKKNNIRKWLKNVKIVNKTFSECKFVLNAMMELLKKISYFGSIKSRKTIDELLDQQRSILTRWLSETPWALKYNVTDELQKAAEKVKVFSIFDFSEVPLLAKLFFNNLSACKNNVLLTLNGGSELLCYFASIPTIDAIEDQLKQYSGSNAYNNYEVSKLGFGYIYYYLLNANVEESAFQSYVGFTLGHEFSHTMFQSEDDYLSYTFYSGNVQNCVMNQYQSTCNEYKEGHCGMNTGNLLEEAGADVLGYHLAYEVLKENIGEDSLKELVPGLPITQQQFFFYSFANNFCGGLPQKSGNHPAANARINSIVQLPAFQEAFQCKNDSRMMKSRTEECHVYGKDAPETRRKKFGSQTVTLM